MRELRHGPAKRFIHGDLLWRVREMIVAPDHMRDFHQRVVYDYNVVIDRHPTRTQDDGVAHYFIRELDFAMDNVMETNWPLRNSQANSTGLALRTAFLRFIRIDRSAFPGV